MKKVLKKMAPVAMATTLTLGGFVALSPAQEASAAGYGCLASVPNYQLSNYAFCGENAGDDVKANIHTSRNDTRYWKMYLQRWIGNGWVTIGTRTGYVSGSSPSHRTFTDVMYQGASMRVIADMYEDSARTQYLGTLKTNTWTR